MAPKTTLLLSLLLASTAQAAPVKVATSIETFASLARAVGGDRVEVQSLSRGYQDPHFVDAKPNLLVVLSQTDLLVFAGLDLEIGWLPPLVTNSRNERIQPGQRGSLDASTAIDVMEVPTGAVSRAQGDIHPRGNPHYWITPVNALKVAKEIADRLKQLDPAGAASYDANLQAFGAQLKARAPAWSEKAKSLKGLKVVSYHKSFGYLARWLGLDEVGYVEDKPGIPPDPKHLVELIEHSKAEGVKLVMVESFYNRSIAQSVADKAGAKLAVIPSNVGATPAIADYPQLIDAILDALLKAAS